MGKFFEYGNFLKYFCLLEQKCLNLHDNRQTLAIPPHPLPLQKKRHFFSEGRWRGVVVWKFAVKWFRGCLSKNILVCEENFAISISTNNIFFGILLHQSTHSSHTETLTVLDSNVLFFCSILSIILHCKYRVEFSPHHIPSQSARAMGDDTKFHSISTQIALGFVFFSNHMDMLNSNVKAVDKKVPRLMGPFELSLM